MAQGLTLVLLGTATLSVTLIGDQYLNYVKPFFFWFLLASGVLLCALGLSSIAAEVRAAREEARGGAAAGAEEGDGDAHDGHGHAHGRAPRVAWLLVLPVAAVFVVAPPALGSYTVNSGPTAGVPGEADASGYAVLEDLPDDPDEPYEMRVQAFVMHAWMDEERRLEGQLVRLTGFAAPAEGEDAGEGWYLARLEMACCAADAIVNKVLVTDQPEPEPDTWFTVEGRWVLPDGDDPHEVATHRFEVETMTEVDDPPDPYE